MTALSARADILTDKPQRYAKQLVAHLGRKLTFATIGAESSAPISGGTGTVVAREGVLTLIAAAPGLDALEAVQQVLGSHLERFATRDRLHVRWVRDDVDDEAATTSSCGLSPTDSSTPPATVPPDADAEARNAHDTWR